VLAPRARHKLADGELSCVQAALRAVGCARDCWGRQRVLCRAARCLLLLLLLQVVLFLLLAKHCPADGAPCLGCCCPGGWPVGLV